MNKAFKRLVVKNNPAQIITMKYVTFTNMGMPKSPDIARVTNSIPCRSGSALIIACAQPGKTVNG